MKRLLALSFMISAFYSCGKKDNEKKISAANDSKDSIEYVRQTKMFITQVKQQKLSNNRFILESNPATMDDLDCLKEALLDTSTFSKQERDYISKKAKISFIRSWTNDIFPKINIVNSDTIRKIFQDHSKGWDYFYSHVGGSSDSFSLPVFYKNYTYCLFYSDHYCGLLCAEGSLVLYKKEGDKWIVVKSFCDWISDSRKNYSIKLNLS